MMFKINSLFIGIFALSMCCSNTWATTAKTQLLSYGEIRQITSDLNEDVKKIAEKLKDQKVSLQLVPSHPAELNNLVVNISDNIYFYCNKRPAGYTGGMVTAKIIKVETTPDDGHTWFTLDNCVR